jgi:hypothetical protein
MVEGRFTSLILEAGCERDPLGGWNDLRRERVTGDSRLVVLAGEGYCNPSLYKFTLWTL